MLIDGYCAHFSFCVFCITGPTSRSNADGCRMTCA